MNYFHGETPKSWYDGWCSLQNEMQSDGSRVLSDRAKLAKQERMIAQNESTALGPKLLA